MTCPGTEEAQTRGIFLNVQGGINRKEHMEVPAKKRKIFSREIRDSTEEPFCMEVREPTGDGWDTKVRKSTGAGLHVEVRNPGIANSSYLDPAEDPSRKPIVAP